MTTTLAAHRCRFVDYTPSAITALTFPPLPLPSISPKKDSPLGKQPLKFPTLAVGRANGNIELCEWTAGNRTDEQARQAWVVRKTLAGPYPSKVDSLAFAIRLPEHLGPYDVPSCSELRLFSSGGGSELIEWDMERGCVRRTISSQGGSIWSIAVNPMSNLLALGCEDGAVRLVSLIQDDLVHCRRFDKVKCRLLSIAWGPPAPRQPITKNNNSDSSDDDDDEWSDSWLVTGGSDSSLRKWDVSTGRAIDRMGTDKMRGEQTLVWAVGVLGDGTIISGDSLGVVKFWDSRTCTQLQSFEGHAADVLCLVVGPEGETVYTSGVDQKVSQFSYIKSSTSTPSTLHSLSRWTKSCSRRLHSHDVRALSIWPTYTPLPPSHKHQLPVTIAPILASGGLDMNVVVTPAALPANTVITKVANPLATSVEVTFEESYQRKLAYSSGPGMKSAVSVARKARLVMCLGDADVGVWRILGKSGVGSEVVGGAEDNGGWEKVLEMELNVHTNLIAGAISDDGKWLAVSDFYEAKLFAIEDPGKSGNDIKPNRIRDFTSILQTHLPNSPTTTGASALCFTPDSSKLVMTTAISSCVLIIELLPSPAGKPCVLRRFDHHRMRNTDRVVKGRPNSTKETDAKMDEADEEEDVSPIIVNISRIAISSDGQWLATSDDRCRTHVFNLDSIQHRSVLPSFSQPIHALAFDPSKPNTLVMGFPNNSLQIYNVELGHFPAWSKHLCSCPPKQLTTLHDPVLGVTFDPARSGYALFWGATWVYKMVLSPVPGNPLKRQHDGKKRNTTSAVGPPFMNRASFENERNGDKLITQFRPILFVDFLQGGELVVVERPLVDVLTRLPPAFFRPKYGAS